jgi:DNA repair protein RadC
MRCFHRLELRCSRKKGPTMTTLSHPLASATPRHAVRELVCVYRPARDCDGHVLRVSTRTISAPCTAAHVLAPLPAHQPVEVFAVACLSARYRLLAWHVVSRGTRASAPVSVPDVFVPARLTPGTSALLLVHNHPSGVMRTPSPEDARLTVRLCTAADILDVGLLDHLIVTDGGRYFSFREAGTLTGTPVRT